MKLRMRLKRTMMNSKKIVPKMRNSMKMKIGSSR